jgi:AcrR family transcriptional regulator
MVDLREYLDKKKKIVLNIRLSARSESPVTFTATKSMRDKHQPNGIPTQVKNPDLVERRRRQIADAAVQLFMQKGFHKSTTRQIARAAGISIGSLYEYFACKEDILFLVCDFIHSEVERGVTEAMKRASGGRMVLAEVVREYFLVCDRMSDFILLIYQETHSLPAQWQQRVLENELRITGLLVAVLAQLAAAGTLPDMDERQIEIAAHNIVVLGHTWTFRRWYLARHYSIDDYIALQTEFILKMCTRSTGSQVVNDPR